MQAGRTCPRSRFSCGDGKCIPRRKVCDRVRNCHNGLDERRCRRGIVLNTITYILKKRLEIRCSTVNEIWLFIYNNK